MTYANNLVQNLGKRGFGTVYKGHLPSGRGIVVKILDESKHSEQQFIMKVFNSGDELSCEPIVPLSLLFPGFHKIFGVWIHGEWFPWKIYPQRPSWWVGLETTIFNFTWHSLRYCISTWRVQKSHLKFWYKASKCSSWFPFISKSCRFWSRPNK